MEGRLKTTWDWVLNVMDATEAQLRFGASLTNSADPAHPLHPLHSPHHQSTTTGSNSLSIGVPGRNFHFYLILTLRLNKILKLFFSFPKDPMPHQHVVNSYRTVYH